MTAVGLLAKMLMAPPVPAGTIAAFDLMRPSRELSVDATGWGWPVGQSVRKPSGPPGTTATFSEYACALAGTPQALLGTMKSRVAPPPSDGPPKGPTGSRVSATRQGVIGTKCSAVGNVPAVRMV